ncbi:hypothetical protein P20429_2008 [Pseudoalteromonas sp. BSi20429]|nr:hypothetical protein P20429_2008 [Pseudoalteromonas sp. BSi20429]
MLIKDAFPTENPLCKNPLAAKDPKPKASPTVMSAQPYHVCSNITVPSALIMNPTKKHRIIIDYD